MSGFEKMRASLSAVSWIALVVATLLAVVLSVGLGSSRFAFADEGNGGETSAQEEGHDQYEDNGNVDLDAEKNAVKENQLPDSSFIYDTSIKDLATADSYYDAQTVQIVGEAVGDLVVDTNGDDHCWLMLWDEDGTVTVYMTKEQSELVDTLGSYSRKGTTLQVRGVFNLVCSEHNGVSDIHATYITVTAKGSSLKETPSLTAFLPGIGLLVSGGLLYVAFRRIREKQR